MVDIQVDTEAMEVTAVGTRTEADTAVGTHTEADTAVETRTEADMVVDTLVDLVDKALDKAKARLVPMLRPKISMLTLEEEVHTEAMPDSQALVHLLVLTQTQRKLDLENNCQQYG